MGCTELTLTPPSGDCCPGPTARFVRWFLHGQSHDAPGDRVSFGMREDRVLSRRSTFTPSAANRSCQRQTQVLDFCRSRA
jgi:hypothetical protein